MNGDVDWSAFIQKTYEAFDRKVNAMLYEAVMAAPEKVLPANRFNKEMQLIADNRDEIIELIDDLQSLTGYEVALVGTKTALSKLDNITPTEYISDAMKQERHTTGKLALWEGVKKVEMPQVFEPGSVTTKMTYNDRILLMPMSNNKFIKMYDEGDAIVKEITDSSTNMDMTIEYEYQQKMGVATVINQLFGQIKILKD